MKLFDLRLRGSGFTLGKLVEEKDHFKFRELIAYLQCNANEDDELQTSFKYEKKVAKNACSPIMDEAEFASLKAWALEEGYCTEQDDVLTFTEKAMTIFQKTIEKDEELSASGFHCCPCHM